MSFVRTLETGRKASLWRVFFPLSRLQLVFEWYVRNFRKYNIKSNELFTEYKKNPHKVYIQASKVVYIPTFLKKNMKHELSLYFVSHEFCGTTSHPFVLKTKYYAPLEGKWYMFYIIQWQFTNEGICPWPSVRRIIIKWLYLTGRWDTTLLACM
jgi:hypothetical protein